tara:strand:- start:765 stop:1574 length:810 start_codon:yes stop_codon:yes gene_type:complete
MSLARNLSKFKPSSSGLVETADIADDAVTTAKVDPAQTDITSVGTLTGLSVSGGTLGVGSNKAIVATTSTANLGRIESANSNTGDSYHGFELTNGSAFKGGLFRKGSDSIIHIFDGGGNSSLQIDTNGRVTKPSQVYAQGIGNSTRHNQTSANTEQSLDFTEVTDNTSSFNASGGIFTAPVAGRYFVHYYASMKSNTSYIQLYVKHNSTIVATDYNELPNNSNDWSAQQVTIILNMGASDTTQPFMVSGGTNAFALENYYRGYSIYLLG